MSEQILIDKRNGVTREAALAALIVGCLIHEEYIRFPEHEHSQGELVINSIRLVAALLKDKLTDHAALPVDY